MAQRAILVSDHQDQASKLTLLLDHFAVPWEMRTEDQARELPEKFLDGGYCVLAPMEAAGRIFMNLKDGEELPSLLRKAESLFFFGVNPTAPAKALLQAATGIHEAACAPIGGEEILCSISDRCAEICGPMVGLEVRARAGRSGFVMTHVLQREGVVPLITAQEGCVFLAAALGGVACFLASSSEVVDLSRSLNSSYYDVAHDFLSAVPLVMYIRHAFAEVIFSAAEAGACVILDDPVLRKKYGFVDFFQLARAVSEHHFSLNVSLIPWNWKRSCAQVIELFKRNSSRLSISVHGCDHSAREFATGSPDALHAKAKLALTRMAWHERRTGLPFDPIMVFPQGAFSSAAPGQLQQCGFTAAVNTDLSSIDQPQDICVSDAWSMAILKYGNFAIYTRRYAFHGLHNFAFDLLLGKPCLVTTHHQDYQNDSRDLVAFIGQLNRLRTTLRWRPLGEVIRRAYQQRWRPDGVREILMFGNEIFIEHHGGAERGLSIGKPGCAPSEIQDILAGDRSLSFRVDRDCLRFNLDLPKSKSTTVRIRYRDLPGRSVVRRSLRSRARLGMRRYLSELRDEAQARAPWAYPAVKGSSRGNGQERGHGQMGVVPVP